MKKSNSILSFYLLLSLLSIPCWILGTIYHVQLFPGFNLYQLPLAMPAVTALILIYRERGTSGISTLLKRTYDFRLIKNKIWYVPILFMFPSIALVEYLILRLSGVIIPPPQLSLATLGYLSVFFMIYFEELGWTGFLIDRFQVLWSPFKSAIVLGLTWAVIHFPIMYINGYSFEWIFWHGLLTIAIRVIFTWIYNSTGKSMFAMALSHWSFGLFWSLWPTENLHLASSFYDPRLMAIITISYTLIIVLLRGPKLLTPQNILDFKKY